MGTWGTGIFAGDLAADVRGDWREALEDGLDPAGSTAKLVAKYAPEGTEEDEEGPTFWIALAAAQSLTGRLMPEIRDRALSVIESGGDVALFALESPALGRKREVALAALAEKLRGPQRPATRIKRPSPVLSPLDIGDLIVVRGSGTRHRTVYFVVTGTAESWPPGSTAPEMVGLLWRGPLPPTVVEATKAPFLRDRDETARPRSKVCVWTVVGPSRGPNAFHNFVEVVASGVHRGDIPKEGSRQRKVFYLGWRLLASEVDGSWFERTDSLGSIESAHARLSDASMRLRDTLDRPSYAFDRFIIWVIGRLRRRP